MPGQRQQRLFGVQPGRVKERRLRVIGSINVPYGHALSLGDTGKITLEYAVKRGQVEVMDDKSIIETSFVEIGMIVIDDEVVLGGDVETEPEE